MFVDSQDGLHNRPDSLQLLLQDGQLNRPDSLQLLPQDGQLSRPDSLQLHSQDGLHNRPNSLQLLLQDGQLNKLHFLLHGQHKVNHQQLGHLRIQDNQTLPVLT